MVGADVEWWALEPSAGCQHPVVGIGSEWWLPESIGGIGAGWWLLETSGGRLTRVVGAGVKLWVSEADGERRSRVVGARAGRNNNLCCHCRNMAGIAVVVGVKWWALEASK